MTSLLSKLFYDLAVVACVLCGICAFALGFALVSQYVFDMQPCILCVYQRIPFVVVIGLSILIWAASTKKEDVSILGLCLASVAFLINSGIAFFHVGVEQKWWKGTEKCQIPDLSKFAGDIDAMKTAIMQLEAPRCDEPQWFFLGQTMAFYNVLLCLALAGYCLLVVILFLRKRNGF